MKYISSIKGKKLPEFHRIKIANKTKHGKNHPKWKGEKVSYGVLHKWIRTKIARPQFCQNCNKKPPKDLANISQTYKRDVNDWEWLCRSCHMIKDGRLEKLKLSGFKNGIIPFNKGKRKGKIIKCTTCGKEKYFRLSMAIGRKYCSQSCRKYR